MLSRAESLHAAGRCLVQQASLHENSLAPPKESKRRTLRFARSSSVWMRSYNDARSRWKQLKKTLKSGNAPILVDPHPSLAEYSRETRGYASLHVYCLHNATISSPRLVPPIMLTLLGRLRRRVSVDLLHKLFEDHPHKQAMNLVTVGRREAESMQVRHTLTIWGRDSTDNSRRNSSNVLVFGISTI